MNNKQFNQWMSSVARAAMPLTHNEGDLYYGVEGCKRFARECGCAIPDFTLDAKKQDRLISCTYSAICVIAYHLFPPVDAKEWIKGMRQGRDKAMDVRKASTTDTNIVKNKGD